MLKRMAKQWVFGWLLFFNLLLTAILIYIILFFTFIPASILLQAMNEKDMNPGLRTFLVGLSIVYGLVVSPLTLPWIVKWKGVPIWTSWDDKCRGEGSRQPLD